MKKIRLLTPVALLILLVGIVTGICQAKDTIRNLQPEVLFVAAGIESSRQQLLSATAVLQIEQKTPKAYFERLRSVPGISSMPTSDELRTITAHWYLKDQKQRGYVVTKSSDKTMLNPDIEFVVVAGVAQTLQRYESSTALSENNEPYYIGAILPREEALQDNIWKTQEKADPRSYAFFAYPGGLPLDRLFLEHPTKHVGDEEYEGSKCMKFEVQRPNLKYVFWIDVEHGYVIRKREEYHGRIGAMTLKRRVTMAELLESKGRWIPARVEEIIFIDPPKTADDDSGSTITRRVVIEKFSVDVDMPADTFMMRWPVGTNITDAINQKKLIVVPITQPDLATLNEARRIQGKPEFIGAAIEAKDLANANRRLRQQGKSDLTGAVAIVVEVDDLASLEKLQEQQEKQP